MIGTRLMKYSGYTIVQVGIVDFGNGEEIINITDPDTLNELEDDIIDTYFNLFGYYYVGFNRHTDDLFKSTDFDQVLQVYSRITGHTPKLSQPSGLGIKLPS